MSVDEAPAVGLFTVAIEPQDITLAALEPLHRMCLVRARLGQGGDAGFLGDAGACVFLDGVLAALAAAGLFARGFLFLHSCLHRA